jgi:phenylalanyl-tRNA synthetase alpha chain
VKPEQSSLADSPWSSRLDEIQQKAEQAFCSIEDASSAEAFRIEYLGRKGILSSLLKEVGGVPPEQRRAFGGRVNDLHRSFEERFAQRFSRKEARKSDPAFDPGLPAFPVPSGSLHPLMKIRDQIRDIFVSMGFSVDYGPDIESDYYNFEALNMPPFHPARDMQDTFYISATEVLRTHTSPVQIRTMEKQRPPIRAIMPGRVYRNEEVSARSYCLFHQIEGLYVDKHVSFSDLKGTLLAFSRRFFDDKTKLRIRPSFFPFTEPSVEIDVECFFARVRGAAFARGVDGSKCSVQEWYIRAYLHRIDRQQPVQRFRLWNRYRAYSSAQIRHRRYRFFSRTMCVSCGSFD